MSQTSNTQRAWVVYLRDEARPTVDQVRAGLVDAQLFPRTPCGSHGKGSNRTTRPRTFCINKAATTDDKCDGFCVVSMASWALTQNSVHKICVKLLQSVTGYPCASDTCIVEEMQEISRKRTCDGLWKISYPKRNKWSSERLQQALTAQLQRINASVNGATSAAANTTDPEHVPPEQSAPATTAVAVQRQLVTCFVSMLDTSRYKNPSPKGACVALTVKLSPKQLTQAKKARRDVGNANSDNTTHAPKSTYFSKDPLLLCLCEFARDPTSTVGKSTVAVRLSRDLWDEHYVTKLEWIGAEHIEDITFRRRAKTDNCTRYDAVGKFLGRFMMVHTPYQMLTKKLADACVHVRRYLQCAIKLTSKMDGQNMPSVLDWQTMVNLWPQSLFTRKLLPLFGSKRASHLSGFMTSEENAQSNSFPLYTAMEVAQSASTWSDWFYHGIGGPSCDWKHPAFREVLPLELLPLRNSAQSLGEQLMVAFTQSYPDLAHPLSTLAVTLVFATELYVTQQRNLSQDYAFIKQMVKSLQIMSLSQAHAQQKSASVSSRQVTLVITHHMPTWELLLFCKNVAAESTTVLVGCAHTLCIAPTNGSWLGFLQSLQREREGIGCTHTLSNTRQRLASCLQLVAAASSDTYVLTAVGHLVPMSELQVKQRVIVRGMCVPDKQELAYHWCNATIKSLAGTCADLVKIKVAFGLNNHRANGRPVTNKETLDLQKANRKAVNAKKNNFTPVFCKGAQDSFLYYVRHDKYCGENQQVRLVQGSPPSCVPASMFYGLSQDEWHLRLNLVTDDVALRELVALASRCKGKICLNAADFACAQRVLAVKTL